MAAKYLMEISEEQRLVLLHATQISRVTQPHWVQIEDKDPSTADAQQMHMMLFNMPYSEQDQPGRLHHFIE
jgi:Flp pilus assembly CpaF family ATPase